MKSIKEMLNENLNESKITREEVFNKALKLKENGIANVEQVESGWWDDKNSFAFEIRYKKGLILKIDFLNATEFIYEMYYKDTSVAINSTEEVDRFDWDIFFKPTEFINMCMSNLKKNISKSKALATKYRKAYDNTDRHNYWEKAVKEESWVETWTKRLTNYENLLKYA